MADGRPGRVYLVDDHPIVLEGLTSLINGQPDLQVCGHSELGLPALSGITETNPDVVTVDLSLKDIEGIELAKRIRSECGADVKILVFSVRNERIFAQRALRAGANGYLMKGLPGSMLLDALREVLKGKTYLSSAIKDEFIRNYVGGPDLAIQSPVEQLSDRELEVFRLLGHGYGTREVAERMHLSIKTVETYRARVKGKFNVSSTQELVRIAMRELAGEDSG